MTYVLLITPGQKFQPLTRSQFPGFTGPSGTTAARWPAPPPPPPELFVPAPGRRISTPHRLRQTPSTNPTQMDLFGMSPPTSPAAGTHLPPPPDSPGAPATATFMRMADVLGLQPNEIELGQKVLLEVRPPTGANHPPPFPSVLLIRPADPRTKVQPWCLSCSSVLKAWPLHSPSSRPKRSGSLVRDCA